MRGKLPAGILALAMLLPGEAVQAQHRFDIGAYGGLAYWTKLLSGDEAGEAVKLKPGLLLGAQTTLWLTDRIGVRGNGAWANRSVSQDGTTLLEDVDLWHLTGDLMFRLRDPSRGSWTPFLAVGAGPTWVRPPGERIGVDFPNDKYWEGDPITASNGDDFFVGQLTVLTGLASLGADFGRSRIGIRAEIGDRFFHPHLHRIDSIGVNTNFLHITPDGDEKLGGLVHELFAQVGVQLRLGLPPRAETPIAATPTQPPAPQPPAPTQPTPTPPPPADERVSICVIDPMSGVRMVDALYRPSTRDTVAASNRAPFRSTLPGITLASTASWYTSGAPVRVASGNRRLEWVSYGSPRMMSGDMVPLGTIDGVTVFAASSDVSSIRARFANAAGTPLATTLGNDRALWTAMEEVRSLYVPVEQVGCRFQELQVRQPSTKG